MSGSHTAGHSTEPARVQGTITPVHELRRGALGVGFVVFFVVSAAAPLTALAGGIPVGMLLGNGAGIPALFVVVTILLGILRLGIPRWLTTSPTPAASTPSLLLG